MLFNRGTLDQMADRAPITTSTPPAATAQSPGITATLSPYSRKDAAMRRARLRVGITTSTGPLEAAVSTNDLGLHAGPLRKMETAAPLIVSASITCTSTSNFFRTDTCVYREPGNAATSVAGEAVTKKARRRPTHMCAAQRARSTTSCDGPLPKTLITGNSRLSTTSEVVASPSCTTQPATLRLCKGTRTRSPTQILPTSASGTR